MVPVPFFLGGPRMSAFGGKQTSRWHRSMSAYDPERTSAATPATAPRFICQPPGPSVMM
jgi:hypothetical protein